MLSAISVQIKKAFAICGSHTVHNSLHIPTEVLADVDDEVEALGAEVDPEVEMPQVRQLHPQHLVHRREDQPGFCVDPVLVQSGLCAQQPLTAARPEQRVV